MRSLDFRTWWTAASARAEPVALAALSLGAAAIHFGVISEHFFDYVLFGVFFSAVGWFEALWAVAYVIRSASWLGWLAVVVNIITVGIWVWAHLIGLPFGPNPGQLEPTKLADLMATLFELLIVLWLSLGFARPPLQRGPRGLALDALVALVLVLIATVALGTTVAMSRSA